MLDRHRGRGSAESRRRTTARTWPCSWCVTGSGF